MPGIENPLPIVGPKLEWLAGRAGPRRHRTFRVRLLVQAGFALTCILLGVQFARFYTAAQAGILPLPTRPPGAEGFLPISGLMGVLDWFYQGVLNPIHPAATILVLVAILMAVLLRKAFCSWVCPVGFLSELVARFGRWSFGRNFRPWKWLDIPLRGLKYLLMAFFVVSVFLMSEAALAEFIGSPYNKVADVKMGLFFTDMSRTGIIVTGSLLVGSVFVQGLWCRYLCPYGALLGIFSWLSPTRVKRIEATCVSCSRCDAVCMARLPISTSGSVLNAECTGCLDCVAACPVKGTLVVQMGDRRVSHLRFAAAVVGLFVAGYVGARATGVWENRISDQEYVERIQSMDGPEYGHPGVGGR
jgi:polyferredoxin